MGIYIKDMDMPLACYNEYGKIVCWHFNDCEAAQNATAEALGMCTERLDDCPLVAVPTPHGRLIDADALRETMYHEAFETDTQMQKWDSGCWVRYRMFEQKEEAAPTVIEAEE